MIDFTPSQRFINPVWRNLQCCGSYVPRYDIVSDLRDDFFYCAPGCWGFFSFKSIVRAACVSFLLSLNLRVCRIWWKIIVLERFSFLQSARIGNWLTTEVLIGRKKHVQTRRKRAEKEREREREKERERMEKLDQLEMKSWPNTQGSGLWALCFSPALARLSW